MEHWGTILSLIGFISAILTIVDFLGKNRKKKEVVSYLSSITAELIKKEPIKTKETIDSIKNPSDTNKAYIKAIELQIEGNLKAARDRWKALSSIIENSKEKATAYFNVAFLYNDERIPNTIKAIEYYTKAINNNPSFATAYSSRAKAYLAKWNINKNEADFNHAIEDFNCSVEYFTSAIDDYKKINLKPKLTERLLELGNAYLEKWQVSKNTLDLTLSITNYTRAININPDFDNAYLNRGKAYYLNGDYSNAIENFGKAISKKANYSEAYFSRGLSYKENGQKEKAISDFKKAKELNTNIDFSTAE